MMRAWTALAIAHLWALPATAQAPETGWRNLRDPDGVFRVDSAQCATHAVQDGSAATTGHLSAQMFRCLRESRWQRVTFVPKRNCSPAVVAIERIDPKRRDSTQTRALLGRIAAEVARRWVPSRDRETTGRVALAIEGFGAAGFVVFVAPDGPATSPTIGDAFPMNYEADTAVNGGNRGVPLFDAGSWDMQWFRATMKYDARCTDVRRADDPSDSSLIDIERTKVYFDFQVQRKARLIDSLAQPAYPEILRSASVEGEVLAQFVVDSLGQVEVGSFKVLGSTHDIFTNSVKALLPRLRFAPAEANGWKVRQLVQQSFKFKL